MKNIKTTATTENERTVTGMDKYIDREALVEWLKRIPLKDLSDGRGLCRVIFEDDFKRAIKKIPKGIIADVAPVRHGRWLHTEEPLGWEDVDCMECSACHDSWIIEEDCCFDDMPRWNYCPSCGAKMDGGTN